MQLTAAFLRATGAWVAAGWQGPAQGAQHFVRARSPCHGGPGALLRRQGRHGPFHPLQRAGRSANPHGARLVSLAPGVIDTDMQVQLRAGDPALFPDRQRFPGTAVARASSHRPEAAAARVLAWLDRPDFGDTPVADVRD
jgi:benzil reductase ((S)-benzoin forming)